MRAKRSYRLILSPPLVSTVVIILEMTALHQ